MEERVGHTVLEDLCSLHRKHNWCCNWSYNESSPKSQVSGMGGKGSQGVSEQDGEAGQGRSCFLSFPLFASVMDTLSAHMNSVARNFIFS